MRPRTEQQALLPRVRGLFVLLVVLVQGVQLVEWLDADTPLWPHRALGALALAATVAWAVGLHRRQRPYLLLDLLLLVSLVVAGWGLGRPGALIGVLIGVASLRALYGQRRSVVAMVVGVLLAYAVVGTLTWGIPDAFDSELAAVAVGLGALATVIRLVGEVLAAHDLASSWDGVLTGAAEDLVGATELDDVERGVTGALERLERVAPDAGGGLWAATIPPGAIPRTGEELATAAASRELDRTAPRLARVLRRLESDRALARDRVLSEQRFRGLAEGSQDAIYVLETWPVLRWRYLNPAAQRVLGVTAEEAARDPEVVLARVHPRDRAQLLRSSDGYGVLLAPARFRVIREDDQRVTWLEANELVIERAEGRPRVVQGVARDVTRQWNEEIALRRALQQQAAAAEDLRHLDEMKSMFLRAVSHELRTPLTAVLGAAITLRRRHELAEEQVEALLEAIRRQATRLGGLLEDLLDVDRLSRGIVEPERSSVDVLALVRRVVAMADDTGRPVTVDGQAVVVDVDGPKVERIVDNLVRNAVTHTPAGTRVRVEVRPTRAGVVISVEDDGPGVPVELRDRIFEPFAQGASTREAPSPGTGIGLALVSKLAELHGGNVRVEQPDGGGARFVVTLPSSPPEHLRRVRGDDDRSLTRIAPD
jgi:PAS domain S-box-containing protein